MSTFNILKNIRENEARQIAQQVSASNFHGRSTLKATMKRWPSPSKIGRQQISPTSGPRTSYSANRSKALTGLRSNG